jgi:XTP/dITP diphosphohydrolase
MKKLVFATNNAHKIAEVKKWMGDKYAFLSLEDIGCREELPETSDTLEGNALQKAEYVYRHYGYPCFAEDTGLEVAALGGKPGVHTARYAGEGGDAGDNMEKLLKELEGITGRTARFRTIIALITSRGNHYLFEGVAKGEIAGAKRGHAGFGYDPVFLPEGGNRSFAEMSQMEKNAISHRVKAMKKLVDFLNEHGSVL